MQPQHPPSPATPATSTSSGPEPPRPDAASILHHVSYNRVDFELPVVSVHPRQHDPIRATLFRPFKPIEDEEDFSLGQLTRLPFEILSLILLELDATSILRLSHVNRSARELVAAIRPFRDLRDHAVEALCILFRSGLGSHVPARKLHEALTTERCRLCGAFGGFVFLPTAERCCLTCVASAPETQVTHLSRVAEAAGTSADGLIKKGLPVLHTLPDSRKRIVAVRPHAVQALEQNGVRDPEAAARRWPDSLTLRFQAATALPFVDRSWAARRRGEDGQVQRGVSCKGCQVAFERDFSDEHLEMRDRFYSREEFLEHFEECEMAQKLWAAAERGDGAVEGPRWMALGRTFAAPRERRTSFARSDRSEE
jgi:hypothetical protein